VTRAFDIAIVGSGFAGSLLAMIARRLGHSVVLVERGKHPRFAIGESSTPLASLLLEKLARDFELPEIAPFSKWGTWQKSHPEIIGGLKRGFTFFHHQLKQPWSANSERTNELLVAASPHDGIADAHWLRAGFDEFFAQQASAMGAELIEEATLTAADFSESFPVLSGTHGGRPLKIRARFVIDASGPRGFLHRALGLSELAFGSMPPTESLYTHFTGVHRWDSMHSTPETTPYPVDDAAVHHVFDGGWIWVLRFNNGITSAGVVATAAMAAPLRFHEGAEAWERLIAGFPSVQEIFASAKPARAFIHAPRLAFRSSVAAAANWAMLPSAAGFVDPLLSTGIPLTLLGVARLAEFLKNPWDAPDRDAGLARYSRDTLRELDATAALVGALHGQMHDFEMFAALTMLYFAAASFAETAQRLDQPELASSFLLLDRPDFTSSMQHCLEAAQGPIRGKARQAFFRSATAALDPINLARLGDPARRNWYPALATDLLAAAPKLGVDRVAIERLLDRCGFAAVNPSQ
jgi:FADH2 O2-dependent halogenase